MTEAVTIRVPGGGTMKGALAVPSGDGGGGGIGGGGDGGGPFPGVVVLHESFGLNRDIRRIAERFAANGYVALAPDLYSHGNRALCLSRVLLAGASNAAMNETLADVEAARAHLASLTSVDGARVAVAGFCLGGGFALLFGTKGSVRAAAVNYGTVPKDADALRGVCPVVASYGGRDAMFAGHGRRLQRHLDELGVANDVEVYDGVGHSFLSYDNAPAWLLRVPSPLRPGYAETEAEDAWRRMLAFFAEHVA
jgi:carboxymethylenebutenolidase